MHGFWPTVPGRKLHIYDFGICQYVYCVLFKHKMKKKLIWYNHNFMLYGRCTNCIMTVTKISNSPSHYIKYLHSAAHQGFLDAGRSSGQCRIRQRVEETPCLRVLPAAWSRWGAIPSHPATTQHTRCAVCSQTTTPVTRLSFITPPSRYTWQNLPETWNRFHKL